jgi:hypothetical protein
VVLATVPPPPLPPPLTPACVAFECAYANRILTPIAPRPLLFLLLLVLRWQGIVTAAAASHEAVWTQSRHSYQELRAEGPPKRWDKESQLDEVRMCAAHNVCMCAAYKSVHV